MASELKVDKFTGVTTAGSIDVVGEGNSTTTNLQQGLAKHFLKCNASSGTPTAQDSFNNASLTDTGTAQIGINFTNPFSSANFALGGSGSNDYGNTQGKLLVKNSGQTDTTSLSNVIAGKYGGQANGEDRDATSMIHFGDLA
jgi:hypothetical protein